MIMKTTSLYIGFLLSYCFFLTSCEKDGEQVIASGFQGATLQASATDIVLTEELKNTLVLQLVWNAGELTLSHGYSAAESSIKTTVQYALDAPFSTVAREIQETSSSLSYTGSALNAFVLAMGLVPDQSSVVYIRIRSNTAANEEPQYSNVIAIPITPYLEMEGGDYLYMATDDLSAFPWKLCSRNEDGKYDGFAEVDQWFNFYLTDEESSNANTIYGSYPEDGHQYVLHSGADRWSCWTSNGGYLYLTADVNTLSWSETVVRSLTVVGDFNGWNASATPMAYNATEKVWTATITTTAAEQWGIKVLINESWGFFFGASGEEGICNLYTSDADGFPYTPVGTHTLTLDLSDPKAFKYTID